MKKNLTEAQRRELDLIDREIIRKWLEILEHNKDNLAVCGYEPLDDELFHDFTEMPPIGMKIKFFRPYEKSIIAEDGKVPVKIVIPLKNFNIELTAFLSKNILHDHIVLEIDGQAVPGLLEKKDNRGEYYGYKQAISPRYPLDDPVCLMKKIFTHTVRQDGLIAMNMIRAMLNAKLLCSLKFR